VQAPRRPVRRTGSEPVEPVEPDRRNARPAERQLDDWATPRRAPGDGPRRGSERPAAATRSPAPAPASARARRPRPAPARRLALPGGVTLPSSISAPLRDFRGAHARRLRLLGPLLVLAAISIGIAALVGAFSSGKHHARLPTLPAIPARSIETQHGAPATVSLDTRFGGATAPAGKLSSLELDLARGFHFDPRAAVACAATAARAGTCPSDSAIGSGTGEIVVQGPYLPQTTYDVTAAVYLTPPTHRGDIAGLALDLTQAQSQLHAVILGRVVPLLTTSYAVVLRFADASRTLSTNYDLNLRRLALTLQASRTVSSHTYHLLTNPTPCTRPGWPLQLSITAGKQAWIYHGAAACGGSSGTLS
jgi:hypothetical protein